VPNIRHTPTAPTRAQRLTAGDRIDAHRHDDHQIVYAGSGVVAVTTDAGTWFAPGTRAIWVPAGTVHAHRAHGRLDLHLVGLPADDNPLGSVREVPPAPRRPARPLAAPGDHPRTTSTRASARHSPSLRPGGPPEHAPDAAGPALRADDGTLRTPLGLDRPAVLAVSPLLRELILAYTRDPCDDSPERHRLRAVLRDQLRLSPQQPLRLPTPADPRLAAVCALVHADPADARTLAALGAATGVGERTLSRLFRSEFGMTFPQWRTQSRLHHALRMLADGLPVTTVAHRCGWSSASAFIDVFRRAFGYTPGAHQRRPQDPAN
jgi:AraC-like DNA-binding protein